MKQSENKIEFSVIIPCYNAEKTIALCLESIINQKFDPTRYEIIVVDNNSKDATKNIIRQYPVKYLFFSRIQSSYAARNFGIKNSKGKIIALTDADCVANLNWLEEASKTLKDETIGAIAGEIIPFSQNSRESIFQTKEKIISQKHTFNHPYMPYALTANAFYRKEIFNKIGYFEENWISGGDADFSWRMQKETKYKIYYCKNCIVKHIHRDTPESIRKQSYIHTIGICLMNEKYNGKFYSIKENTGTIQLIIKYIKNIFSKYTYIFLYSIFKKNELYFKILEKERRIGFLTGLLKYKRKTK